MAGGRVVRGLTVLQEMNKLEDSSPSLRCVRCPKVEIFVEMFRTNLQTRTLLYVTQRHKFEISKGAGFQTKSAIELESCK